MDRCKVLIPGPLLSYTKQRHVEAAGPTLGALLGDLDLQFPGIRFRMVDEQDHVRPHMRIFINGTQVSDLGRAIRPADNIHIVQALSGG
jgi:molybdopterin converting factor small subunit